MGCHSFTVLACVVGPLLYVAGSVGLDVSIVVYCLASFFSGGPVVSCPPGCRLMPSRVSSIALQGALQDGFCNGVVSSDVAKPGELASFHLCQQGLLLSSSGVHSLSHMFIYLVFSIRNAGKSFEAFRFKCLYASLCFCCQSPALASVEEDGYKLYSSVELELHVEADVSVLSGGVKSSLSRHGYCNPYFDFLC